MKRVFTFILVVCTLLLLAACGNNSQPDSVCQHTFDQWVVEKQATCKEEGLLTRSCTKCNYMEATKIEKTNDHTEVFDPEVPATCEKTGLSEGKHCAVCGKVFVSQQETPIVAHTYDDKYDESCNVCGHIRDAECAHKETEVIAGKAATCTEIGLTDGSKCKKCGEILVAQTTIPVIDHTESDWIVDIEATTTTEGKKHTECTVCGVHIAEDSIPTTEPPESEGLVFKVYDTYCEVSGIGTCTDLDIAIPTKHEDLPVTAIGFEAFAFCTNLTSIIIPDSVTTIGIKAFSYCTSLTSVTIPDSVTTIGDGAFEDCSSLTSITIPDRVTTIGKYSFWKCTSLTSVTITDSVTSIGVAAFYGCTSLQSIPIPDSVTTIGNGAFQNCTSLTSIIIPDRVTIIGSEMFVGCINLTGITIPDSVTTIGSWAFCSCTSLQSVTIPDSVTSIGLEVFYGCDSLTGIWVSENNPAYSSDETGILFNEDKTKLIQAPGGLKGAYTIPDSVIGIGDDAFYHCTSLQSVTIPDSVAGIDSSAFSGCGSLTGIWVSENNSVYSSDKMGVLFNKDKSALLRAPGGLKGAYTIPDSVTTIVSSAFNGCTSLTRVTIGDSVTTIGDKAFYDCSSLTNITFQGTMAQWNNIAFGYSWNANVPATKVTCSNGSVSLN